MAASDLVENQGYSYKAAAAAFNVPRVTLIDHLKGRHKTGGGGRRTVLSDAEEKALVNVLKEKMQQV